MRSNRNSFAALMVGSTLLWIGAVPSRAGGSADLELSRVELIADGWSGLGSLDGFGIRVEWAPDSWPVRFAVDARQVDTKEEFCPDLGVPCDEFGSADVELSLLSLGVVYRPWGDKTIHPRLAAGISRTDAQVDLRGADGAPSGFALRDQDDLLGYIELGLEGTITPRWHAALAVRRTLGGDTGDTNARLGLGTQQFTLSFGYDW